MLEILICFYQQEAHTCFVFELYFIIYYVIANNSLLYYTNSTYELKNDMNLKKNELLICTHSYEFIDIFISHYKIPKKTGYIINPLLVVDNGDKYEVVYGNNRYLSGLELGIQEFPIQVLKDGEVICCGVGQTKKKAEQNASYNALVKFNVL